MNRPTQSPSVVPALARAFSLALFAGLSAAFGLSAQTTPTLDSSTLTTLSARSTVLPAARLPELQPGVHHYTGGRLVPGVRTEDLTYRLQGTAEFTLRAWRTQHGVTRPDRAIVACWLCEDGSCGEDRGWGPSVLVAGGLRLDGASGLPFDLYFGELPSIDPTFTPARVRSWYCNLRFTVRGETGGPSGAFLPTGAPGGLPSVPSPPPVWELSGRMN